MNKTYHKIKIKEKGEFYRIHQLREFKNLTNKKIRNLKGWFRNKKLNILRILEMVFKYQELSKDLEYPRKQTKPIKSYHIQVIKIFLNNLKHKKKIVQYNRPRFQQNSKINCLKMLKFRSISPYRMKPQISCNSNLKWTSWNQFKR